MPLMEQNATRKRGKRAIRAFSSEESEPSRKKWYVQLRCLVVKFFFKQPYSKLSHLDYLRSIRPFGLSFEIIYLIIVLHELSLVTLDMFDA